MNQHYILPKLIAEVRKVKLTSYNIVWAPHIHQTKYDTQCLSGWNLLYISTLCKWTNLELDISNIIAFKDDISTSWCMTTTPFQLVWLFCTSWHSLWTVSCDVWLCQIAQRGKCGIPICRRYPGSYLAGLWFI